MLPCIARRSRHFAFARDAEDATQDTFLRAWKTINRFRGEATFKTWVLTIAWNRAVTRRRLRMNWWRRRASAENVLVAVTHAYGPEDIARGLEMRRHIGMAIEGLSIKLRDALLLTQSGVYSYEEVAAMLGIAEGTLKWRVSEARRRVRERLAALGYVEK